jgi:hypothetical protein
MSSLHSAACNCLKKRASQYKMKRSEAIPVTGHGSLWNCEMSGIPHCLDNRLIDGGYVVSLTRLPRSTAQEQFIILFSVRGWVNPRDIVWPEGLVKFKIFMDLIKTRTRDLPACNILPQPGNVCLSYSKNKNCVAIGVKQSFILLTAIKQRNKPLSHQINTFCL